VATELPDDLKFKLGELQAGLKSIGGFKVKWVSPQGIHLTLKFLGNVASDRIEMINEAIREACRGIAPLRLKAEGLGVFPNVNRAQVAWVGMKGDVDEMVRLQKAIDLRLEGLGFAPEKRPFVAHLTLARVREGMTQAERHRFGELISSTPFEADEFEVCNVSLMRSQLTPGGAIYTRIGSVKL